MGITAAQALMGFWLALLFAGCRLAVGRTLVAALVVLPLALLVPWRVPVQAIDQSQAFPPVAAAVWVLWLVFERRRENARRLPRTVLLALAAGAAAAAVVVAPQALVVLAAVALYYAVRPGRRSLAPAAALVGAPLAYITLVCLASSGGAQASTLDRLSDMVRQGWNTRPWFQSAGSYDYHTAVADLNAFFYVPLLPVMLACALPLRREWWFAPTFAWGAALAAGTLFLDGTTRVELSQPLQMALAVPLGIAGVQALRAMRRPPAGTAAP